MKEMNKKFTEISQSISVQTMGRFISILEYFLEFLGVNFIDAAKALRQETIKLRSFSVPHNNPKTYMTQFSLLSSIQFHLHQLMCALLKVQSRLNGEIDGSSQRYQIGFRVVDDHI
jgi:hypothetical protein